jgi:hypothetical protein
MLARLTGFGTFLFMAAFTLVGGALIVVGGYWLSDRVYDAGVWPIGALLRVALLFMTLGFAFGVLSFLFMAMASLVRGEE